MLLLDVGSEWRARHLNSWGAGAGFIFFSQEILEADFAWGCTLHVHLQTNSAILEPSSLPSKLQWAPGGQAEPCGEGPSQAPGQEVSWGSS